MLHVLVNAHGGVDDVKVVSAVPQGIFEAAATKAALGWKFKVKRQDGMKFPGWVRVPVNFDPADSKAPAPIEG